MPGFDNLTADMGLADFMDKANAYPEFKPHQAISDYRRSNEEHLNNIESLGDKSIYHFYNIFKASYSGEGDYDLPEAAFIQDLLLYARAIKLQFNLKIEDCETLRTGYFNWCKHDYIDFSGILTDDQIAEIKEKMQ